MGAALVGCPWTACQPRPDDGHSTQGGAEPATSPGAGLCDAPCSPQRRAATQAFAQGESSWTYNAESHTLASLRAQPATLTADLDSAEAFRAWQVRGRSALNTLLRTDQEIRPDLPLSVRTLETVDLGSCSRHSIDYLVEPGLRVPAYLFVPHGEPRHRPGVVVWHGHDAGGKDAVAGAGAYTEDNNAHRAAARRLAEAGYVVLAPDIRSFGETGDGRRHEHYVRGLLLHGRLALGVFLADARRAIDVLQSRDEVDPGRIATAGFGLGGQISLLLAATDRRVGAAVVQGALGSVRGGLLNGPHCDCQYVPGLGGTLDVADIALLSAPIPVRFAQGSDDPVFPMHQANQTYARIERGYQLLGEEDAVGLYVQFGAGHEWIHEAAAEWLDRHLGTQSRSAHAAYTDADERVERLFRQASDNGRLSGEGFARAHRFLEGWPAPPSTSATAFSPLPSGWARVPGRSEWWSWPTTSCSTPAAAAPSIPRSLGATS